MARAFYASAISEHRAKTPEGYLICLGVPIARTGWQKYRASDLGLPGDGIIDVYRDEKEVFSPATIASFEGKSLTSPHPPTFLNPQNDLGYSRGHVQNVRRGEKLEDGEYSLIADFVIKDQTLIMQVENGSLKETSAGYNCEYLPISEGSQDYSQRLIRGNHVAVVPYGRAGSSVRIMDSKEEDEERQSLMQKGWVAEMLEDLGWKRPTQDAKEADSDPGAVERNEEKNKLALERAERRNEDAMNEEEKKDLKDTKDAQEKLSKEVKDATGQIEKIGEAQKTTDATLKRIADAMEKMSKEKESEDSKAKDACTCEAGKGEAHAKDCPMFKKESEDSELIPVGTLAGEEIPKNPIGDALGELLKLKPVIARSGNKEAKDAWNTAYETLKGANYGGDGNYLHLVDGKKPESVRAAEEQTRVRTSDSASTSEDFVKNAKQFHRKNPGEVKPA